MLRDSHANGLAYFRDVDCDVADDADFPRGGRGGGGNWTGE